MSSIDTYITTITHEPPVYPCAFGSNRKSKVRRLPCVLMRGGTSRGPYFLESDLPADTAARDRVLLAAMGSPHPLQLDGLGGANPLTSKVAIISAATVPGADVDYLFVQVSIEQASVDTGPNCGNMLSGVGPFAIEAGLVQARVGETKVRIYNRNTNSFIDAIVQTPDGEVEYEGSTRIDGVAGPAAAIRLSFGDAAGGKTGSLFASGQCREVIEGVEVTLIDYAMPMMLLAAKSLGLDGDETPAKIDANRTILDRIEVLRLEAGRRMGLGDVTGRVIPKVGILSAPRNGGSITSRYLVPGSCHRSHSATGALCIAAAAMLPGTIASEYAAVEAGKPVVIEHPAGRIEIAMKLAPDGQIERAEFVRTARRIFEGHLLVPAHLYETR